jgi:hypothetical protein
MRHHIGTLSTLTITGKRLAENIVERILQNKVPRRQILRFEVLFPITSSLRQICPMVVLCHSTFSIKG